MHWQESLCALIDVSTEPPLVAAEQMAPSLSRILMKPFSARQVSLFGVLVLCAALVTRITPVRSDTFSSMALLSLRKYESFCDVLSVLVRVLPVHRACAAFERHTEREQAKYVTP